MKFIRPPKADGEAGSFAFLLSKREKALLLATLKLYPLLDASFHQLSRDPKTARKAEQQWLEENMAQQRRDHKKKLDQFFHEEQRFFHDSKNDFRFTLNAEQIEWFLRVLNEIRVGSWVQLGRPELPDARKIALSGEKARSLAAMELSGYFQSALLEAFR